MQHKNKKNESDQGHIIQGSHLVRRIWDKESLLASIASLLEDIFKKPDRYDETSLITLRSFLLFFNKASRDAQKINSSKDYLVKTNWHTHDPQIVEFFRDNPFVTSRFQVRRNRKKKYELVLIPPGGSSEPPMTLTLSLTETDVPQIPHCKTVYLFVQDSKCMCIFR